MEERPLEREIRDSIKRGIDPDLYPSWSAYGWPNRDVKYPLSNTDLDEELKERVYIGTLADFKKGPYPLERSVSLLTDTNNQSLIYGAVLHGKDITEFDEEGLPDNLLSAQRVRNGINRAQFEPRQMLSRFIGSRLPSEGYRSDILFDEFVSLMGGFRALDVYEHMKNREIEPEKVLTWKHNGQPVDSQ